MSKNKHKHEEEEENALNETLSKEEVQPEDSQPVQEEMVSVKKADWERVCSQLSRINAEHYELEKDFDNFRLRAQDNVRQARLDGLKDALMTMFSALDSFKKARSMVKDESALEGINMIEKSILSSLSSLKVERINAVGEKFNPQLHNAVFMQESKDAESGTILDEVESGYMFDGKVLKYSQVIVAK